MLEPLGLIGALLESATPTGNVKFPGGATIYPRGGPVTAIAPLAELFVRRGRTTEFTGGLYAADKSTGITLSETDTVRVKIGRSNGNDVDLDLDSTETTENGSGVIVDSLSSPAAIRVRLAQGDLAALTPGAYLGEISVVDSAEIGPTNAIKFTQEFIVQVLRSMNGDTGL